MGIDTLLIRDTVVARALITRLQIASIAIAIGARSSGVGRDQVELVAPDFISRWRHLRESSGIMAVTTSRYTDIA